MIKVALQANSCYNEDIRNIVRWHSATNTTPALIHLVRRCIVDILSQKTCSKCGNSYPLTSEYFSPKKAYKGRKPRFSSECRQCKHAMDKAYAAENKAHIKEYKDQYNATHKEQRKQYDLEHKERIIELRNKRAQEKAELISAQHKQYCKTYYKTERGRIQQRVSTAKRRARKRHAPGSYTSQELSQQYQRQKGKCYYCHTSLSKGRHSWVAEHITPLARGGHNTIDNIVIACQTCNLQKGYKLPHEWDKGGRLL